ARSRRAKHRPADAMGFEADAWRRVPPCASQSLARLAMVFGRLKRTRENFCGRPRLAHRIRFNLRKVPSLGSLCGRVRIWWNWQTRYFEVVVGQPVQVQVLLCAPIFLSAELRYGIGWKS